MTKSTWKEHKRQRNRKLKTTKTFLD